MADRDPAMAEFLDIFNHRLSTLRYELKAASVPGVRCAAPGIHPLCGCRRRVDGFDRVRRRGRAHSGAACTDSQRALLALCGLVGDGRKSAAQAVIVMGIYLQTHVHIEELRGAWRTIETNDRTRLGHRKLIDTAPLGRRVWVNHAAVGMTIGPVSYKRLCSLVANRAHRKGDGRDPHFGRGHAGLVAMVLYLFDRHVDVEVTILVEDGELPPPFAMAAATRGRLR